MNKKRNFRRHSQEDFNKDFSNKTVIIMLIVVVVVSALSLGFYVNTYHTVTSSLSDQQRLPSNVGVVSLQILNPPLEESSQDTDAGDDR
ncbi:MAG: hypothetical protein Q8R37_02815 [Nanoarchaeota archaeon]|nr:hypothetical protein [Nanoarchaeota archaeon]